MATCVKCRKDVKSFAVVDAGTNQGTCEPCAAGKPVAAAPVATAAPAALAPQAAPRPAMAPSAPAPAPAPAPVAAAPEPKVEKRTMVGKVTDAVKGAMTKIRKVVKKDDKTKKKR